MSLMKGSRPIAFSFLVLLSGAVFAAGTPIKLHGLPSADFEKLPGNAQLDVGGRILTKSQFLAELQTGPAALAPPPGLDALAAQVAQEDKAKADQANGLVLARAKSPAVKAPASPLKPVEPHITDVPFVASPGYLVLVLGAGFGERAGELHLRFPNGGVDLPLLPPGARVDAQVAGQLESNRVWADDQVVALTPGDLGGAVGQTAEVVVVRADGKRSAPASIRFIPAREVRRIPADRIRQMIPDDGGCGHYPTSSLACQYGSNFHIWHFGEDEVRPEKTSFKNGWRQYLTWFTRALGSATPGCHARVVASPPIPPFDQPMFVSWWGDCQTTYTVSYTIVGPRGVPYE
jgi:hypothetical protein